MIELIFSMILSLLGQPQAVAQFQPCVEGNSCAPQVQVVKVKPCHLPGQCGAGPNGGRVA